MCYGTVPNREPENLEAGDIYRVRPKLGKRGTWPPFFRREDVERKSGGGCGVRNGLGSEGEYHSKRFLSSYVCVLKGQ